MIKSDIPPGPYKNCVFCQGVLGKTLVPYDESKPGRPPVGHAYEHNPFRCPAANPAADQFCAEKLVRRSVSMEWVSGQL